MWVNCIILLVMATVNVRTYTVSILLHVVVTSNYIFICGYALYVGGDILFSLAYFIMLDYQWDVNSNQTFVCALNLFPVGSAENEESSSDVQAEGGKPSGMYCYLYYSVWVCQRHRSATSCISDNLFSLDFIYWGFFSSLHFLIACL